MSRGKARMPLLHGGAVGTPWRPAVVPLLLTLCLTTSRSVAFCPTPCLCASDIISCSGRNLSTPPFELPGYTTRLDLSHNTITILSAPWTSQTQGRLKTLVLNWNFISEIQENAFAVTPLLTNLDLSSNQLSVLNSSVFSDLKELRELLLFGNYITHIEPGAFRNLFRLQRLYLSGNMLTQFPLSLYKDGPRDLTFLDLSSNLLTQLPVQNLLSLKDQSGIYLQNNPLLCDSAVQALMEYWTWKQYQPLVDFRASCKQGSDTEFGLEQGSQLEAEVQPLQVEPGRGLSVPCPGFSAAEQEEVLAFWVTPHTVLNSSGYDPSGDLNQRFTVLPNGTLEIKAALEKDSGTYACVASRGRRLGSDESMEVSVVVGNLSSAFGDRARRTGHFTTAFTTLASCVVSIVLVLLYLYLTPCRCGREGGSGGCGGRAIIICSDPREVELGQRRANGKRVAFLDPQVEDCNNGCPKTPALTLGHVGTEGILKNGSRTVGQTLTDTGHSA